MPPKCVISTCQPNANITVFNFPIQKEKREIWLKALNLDVNYEFKGPTGVCELHFQPSYIRFNGPTKVVGVNAIPDLQPRIHPKHKLEKAYTRPSNSTATVTHQNNVKLKLLKSPRNNHAVFIEMNLDDTNFQPNSVNLSNLEEPIVLPMIEPDSIKIEVENPECGVHDPLDPFLNRIRDIQQRNKENAELQAEMKACKKRLSAERRKLARIKKNIQESVSRCKLSDADKQNIEDFDRITKLREIHIKPELKIPKLIFDRFSMVHYIGLKYPNDLKQFAIELFLKSPIAYDFVRESFCDVLPHSNAILRWTECEG